MANVIIFIEEKPSRLLKMSQYKTCVDYMYSDATVRKIPVEIVFATFLNDKSGVVLVAADRELTLREILLAHGALIINSA